MDEDNNSSKWGWSPHLRQLCKVTIKRSSCHPAMWNGVVILPLDLGYPACLFDYGNEAPISLSVLFTSLSPYIKVYLSDNHLLSFILR